ncbi:MAG: Cof-type HAD-IIB family hydrolase [Lachnospiraceae bacterium]
MGIKLIAVDLDGTLLRRNCTIASQTAEAIHKALAAGIYIVPATGRSFRNAQHVLSEFNDIQYFINANGTTVTDGIRRKLLYAETMPIELVREVYALTKEYETFIEIYEGMDAIVDEPGVEMLYSTSIERDYIVQLLSTNIKIKSLDAYLQEAQHKVSKLHIVCQNAERKEALFQKIDKIKDVYPLSTMSRNVEIVNKTWSKKDGLEKLAGTLGIDREEIMAIGDSDNDYDMLKWVGTSVAMGNAKEHIREIADLVTATNEDNGVAAVITDVLTTGRY